jgi:hypothetical protein
VEQSCSFRLFDFFPNEDKNILEMSTLSFLISPHVKISESELWGIVGRDELHIEKAPSAANESTNGKYCNYKSQGYF